MPARVLLLGLLVCSSLIVVATSCGDDASDGALSGEPGPSGASDAGSLGDLDASSTPEAAALPFTTWRITKGSTPLTSQSPDAGGWSASQIHYDDGRVYFTEREPSVSAATVDGRSAADGARIWRSTTPLHGWLSAGAGRVGLSGHDLTPGFTVFDGATGAAIWSQAGLDSPRLFITKTRVFSAVGFPDLSVSVFDLAGAPLGSTSITPPSSSTSYSYVSAGAASASGFFARITHALGPNYMQWRVAKVDNTGSKGWAVGYDPYSTVSLNRIATNAADDGALYAIGSMSVPTDAGAKGDSSFLAKFDAATGSVVYQRMSVLGTFGASGVSVEPVAMAVCGDALYVLGYAFLVSSDEWQYVLVQLSAATGAQTWRKEFLDKFMRFQALACSSDAVFLAGQRVSAYLEPVGEISKALIEKRSAATGDFDPTHHVEYAD